MAYKKQNFEDGQILTAEQLNHIEDGIIENEKNASKALRYDYQNLSTTQQSQARVNIGAIGQGDLEDATNVALEKAKASGEFDGADGKDGVDGKDGKDGENGKTPYIHNGYWFIGEVNTGVKAQGIDGYTPRKGVDYFDGKDGKDGAQGEKGDKGDKGDTGAQGQQGEKGADGYTPVKYKDYFTEADKAEMVQAVITALPKYNGEVEDI